MMLIPIQCPNCGNVIASTQDRRRHDVIIQSVRIRRGAHVRSHYSAIASCDARIVGAGDSFEAALVAFDGRADALMMPSTSSSDVCGMAYHTSPRALPIDRLSFP